MTDRTVEPESPGGPGTSPLPPVPDHIREAARHSPDHWLGDVDPGWTAPGPPPPWAVTGEWRSGADGDVVEWQPNDGYRPSPLTLGWPEPTDPVDTAVQLAVTGYGLLKDAVTALAGAEVTVLRAPGGGALTVTGEDGEPAVPVFTSAPHQVFEGALAHDTVTVAELVRTIAPDDGRISVNPAGPARLLLDARHVLQAVAPPGPPVTTGSADLPRTSPTSPVTQRTP